MRPICCAGRGWCAPKIGSITPTRMRCSANSARQRGTTRTSRRGERDQPSANGIAAAFRQPLRAFVVVLAGALMLTAGLVLFAFSERDRAEQNAQIAEENRAAAEASAELAERSLARSNSFALSALAGQALNDGNSEMAVALAVEANLISDSPPPQASLTLADVAFAPGTRQISSRTAKASRRWHQSRRANRAAANTDGVAIYDRAMGETADRARCAAAGQRPRNPNSRT